MGVGPATRPVPKNPAGLLGIKRPRNSPYPGAFPLTMRSTRGTTWIYQWHPIGLRRGKCRGVAFTPWEGRRAQCQPVRDRISRSRTRPGAGVLCGVETP
jgi:hypothetical protein